MHQLTSTCIDFLYFGIGGAGGGSGTYLSTTLLPSPRHQPCWVSERSTGISACCWLPSPSRLTSACCCALASYVRPSPSWVLAAPACCICCWLPSIALPSVPAWFTTPVPLLFSPPSVLTTPVPPPIAPSVPSLMAQMPFLGSVSTSNLVRTWAVALPAQDASAARAARFIRVRVIGFSSGPLGQLILGVSHPTSGDTSWISLSGIKLDFLNVCI
ncbi:MAG: hypothetical protein HHAS10_02810 [Candidatus Altimarinota bacterium]